MSILTFKSKTHVNRVLTTAKMDLFVPQTINVCAIYRLWISLEKRNNKTESFISIFVDMLMIPKLNSGVDNDDDDLTGRWLVTTGTFIDIR